jgi:hypothetical protein
MPVGFMLHRWQDVERTATRCEDFCADLIWLFRSHTVLQDSSLLFRRSLTLLFLTRLIGTFILIYEDGIIAIGCKVCASEFLRPVRALTWCFAIMNFAMVKQLIIQSANARKKSQYLAKGTAFYFRNWLICQYVYTYFRYLTPNTRFVQARSMKSQVDDILRIHQDINTKQAWFRLFNPGLTINWAHPECWS